MATELGSLAERLRALESSRSGMTSEFVTGSQTVSAAPGGNWTQPGPWATLDVAVSTIAGVLVIGGCTVIEPPLATAPNQVYFGVGVDGFSPSNGQQGVWQLVGAANPGDPYPIWMVGVWPAVKGSGAPYGAAVGLGSHTFAPQVSGVGTSGTSAVVTNMFLVVAPL
jgi:hypothetical protein